MKNRKVIEELYISYIKQRKDALSLISSDEDKIREIDDFLASVNTESEDLKIFSPHNVDELYEGKINEDKQIKEELLNEISVQRQLVDELSLRIDQFKQMLDEEPDDDVVKAVEEAPSEDFEDLKSFVVDFQEKERQHIASELHDTAVQNLVHLIHSLELSSLFIDQDPVRAKLELEGCIKSTKAIIEDIRVTIFNLRPMSFDDLGFDNALEEFIKNMKLQYPDVTIEYTLDNFNSSTVVNISIFRIIQECVVNSLRHSQSTNLLLNVKVVDGNSCKIVIRDSGIGFDYNDKKNNHFGLSIIEERVKLLSGTLDIDSVKGEGTTVTIVIPL